MPEKRNSSKARVFLGLCFVFVLASGALGMIGHNPLAGLLSTAFLALTPLPFDIALVYWLDRMEPEPPALIARTFIWGATSAIVLAMILEAMGDVFARLITHSQTAFPLLRAVVIGPAVEESLKAAALYSIIKKHPDDFEDVSDGIIYAAMVGLGFALTENIFYYESAWVRGGLAHTLAVFGVRAVLGAYSHPLFTAMTGIGLGIAAQKKAEPPKSAAPWLGLAGAIFLHGLWNLSAGLGLGFFAVYALIMVPAFFIVLHLFRSSLRNEEQFLRAHLETEYRDGHLSNAQYDEICDGARRLHAAWRCLANGQFKAWLEQRRLQLAAKELAFHRYRVALRGLDADPLERLREREYLNELRVAAAKAS